MDFYGIYQGVIASNADPSGMKRAQLRVPRLFGDNLTAWARPSAPAAPGTAPSITVPANGTIVWVMFENGDPDYPVWISG